MKTNAATRTELRFAVEALNLDDAAPSPKQPPRDPDPSELDSVQCAGRDL